MANTFQESGSYGQVLTAMITPFDSEGNVEFQRLDRLCRHLVANGSDGLVVTGTTGESPTLSAPETVAVWRAAIDAVGSKVPVIAGTGTNDTAHTIEMSIEAASQGADAVLVVNPYYNKPDQRGLFAHFSAVAEATPVPVILYNIPGRSACLLEVETMVRLADHPNIVGVKDAVDDLEFSKRALEALPPSFVVYSGSDNLTLPLMKMGAVGVISVASHLLGNQIKEMVAWAAVGADGADDLHAQLLPSFLACFSEPSPQPLKGAMNILWEYVGECRLPLVKARQSSIDDLVSKVRKAIDQ